MADITTSRIVYNNEGPPIQANGFIRIDSSGATDNYYLEFYEASNQRFRIYENSDNVYFDGGPGSTHFRPRQGGGSGFFLINGANVGIGLTSPGHALDVSGNIRLQGGDRKIIFNNGSVECSLDQMAGGVGGLGTLARFGVGTIAPNNALQVVGNITFGTGVTNEAVRNMMTGGTMVFQAADANHRIIIRGTQNAAGTITGNSNNMDFYEFGGYNFYTGVNTGSSARTLALSIASDGDATFTGDIILSNNDVAKTIKSSVNGGAIQLIGNHDSATNPDRGLYLGRINNNGVFSSSLSFINGDNAAFAGEVVIQGSSHSTFKIKSGNNDNILFAQAIQSDNARIGTDTNTPLSFFTNQAERMRIDNSGNVGIGITSPENLLHIKASDGVTGVLKIEGGKNTVTSVGEINSQLDFGSNDGSVWSSGNVGGRIASVTEVTNGAYTGMAFYTFRQGASAPDSLSEKMRITNDGNVGIGTTTPQKKVHIEGDTGASASQLLVCGPSDTVGHTAGILLRAEGGEGDSALRAKGGIFFEREAANGLGKLHLCNNNSNNNDSAGLSDAALTIIQGKNVGIGTTSPAKQLEILYPSNIDKDTVEGLLRLTGQHNVENASGTPSAGVGIEFYNKWNGGGSNAAYSMARISARAEPSYNGGLQFDVSDNTAAGQSNFTTAMTIDPDARVGIGTTSPGAKLDVNGELYVRNVIYAYAGAGNQIGGISWINPDSGFLFAKSGNATKVLLNSNGDSYLNGGNVGIGTTSPDFELDVAGSIGIDDYIYHNGDHNTYIRAQADQWTFRTGGDDRMHIDNTGVGIGTTSPGQKLDVAGNVVIRGGGSHLANSGVGELKLGYAFASSGGTAGSATRLAIQPYAHTGGPFIFVARDTSSEAFLDIGYNAAHLTLKHDGKLGIGRTSPSHKLDVNGDARFVSNSSSRVLTLLQQGNNNGNIIQFQNHNGGNVWEVVGRNNQFYIYNNALTSFALFIDPSNSNIGIGNTSPSQKLHVTGSVLASSDVVAFSDKKLKENIKTLDGSKVYNMRGVSFTRKDTGKDSSGVIAQEIQKIAPELVTDNDGTLSVAYGNLTGYLIEAVKELKTEVEQLKKQIKNGNSV